jgi:8-amino-7-oxononanoate synthase
MGLLHARLAKYDLPQKMMEKGVYPYFREIESKQGTEVEMEGHKVLMFGSNAYTGLTGDERVIEAGVTALRQYGSGCAGSRFLNGTLDIHVQLEKELAAFVGKDEALCFSTGFTVNSGVIPQLLTGTTTSSATTATTLPSWMAAVSLSPRPSTTSTTT